MQMIQIIVLVRIFLLHYSSEANIVLFTPYNFFTLDTITWMFLSMFYSSVYCPNKAFLLTFHIVLIWFLAKHVFR